ncbi:hypothetical protein C8R43DRAFT_1052830 [Mycena crocata]|nr:hypothetical protein C8R43DRAFT_1052830 [Mycena crocata]
MSTKNRAIGDTEDEFQAALATYTKAGNKTAAMRRLWNAAYLIGCQGAVAVTAAELEQAKQTGFEEGRRSGFEKGHRAGKKDVNVDAVEVSFAAGKTEGMEQGREAETKRWKDGGHLEDGTCRAIVDSSPPPKSLPLDGNTRTFSVPGAFSVQGFNWADDAEFLPTHPVLVVSTQPRDFSGMRSGSTNPFDTLQRRQARYYGAQTRGRRPGRLRFHSTAATNRHGPTSFDTTTT